VKRRDLLALVAGVTMLRPLAARAQQPESVRRIGVLLFFSEGDPEAVRRVNVLEEALKGLGWIKGRNLHVDYRWAAADSEGFRHHAADLVRLKVDAIIAASTPAAQAMQRETRTIAIVFTQVSDPVGQGIVKNTRRPGGMTTGFSNYDPEIGGKWVQLLKEAVPNLTRAAVVFNPKTAPYTTMYLRAMEAVAPSIGVNVFAEPIHGDAEIEAVFAKHRSAEGSGLIFMTDAFISVHRKRIIELAARFAVPAIYPYRYYIADGGLISYGADQLEQYRGAANYVDRILKGEKPGDLPVQAPDRYALIVNMKAAKALGLTVPHSLLQRADEVIE
jgi:putative tryptophan/tyrosine transport system substrate-binding protein